jgi:hypothetical protein
MLNNFRDILDDHTQGWGKVANGALKREREERMTAERAQEELAEAKAENEKLRKRLRVVARLVDEEEEGSASQILEDSTPKKSGGEGRDVKK